MTRVLGTGIALLLCAVISLAGGTVAAEPPALLVSEFSDRHDAEPLAGADLAGVAHVFVSPSPGITRVKFWLDDPTRSGSPRQVERRQPWDLAGTKTDGTAFPLDTTTLADGEHRVTVLVEYSDGTSQSADSAFTVTNSVPALSVTPTVIEVFTVPGGNPVERAVTVTSGTVPATVALVPDQAWITTVPPGGSTPLDATVRVDPAGLAEGTYSGSVTVRADGFAPVTLTVTLTVASEAPPPEAAILVSSSSGRAPSFPLSGATLAGKAYIYVPAVTGVSRVRFWLDDPARTGSPYRTERSAPYDLAGGTFSTAAPLDTTKLSEGTHHVSAALDHLDGTSQSLEAEFVVSNTGPALAFTPAAEVVAVPSGRPIVTVSTELSASSGTPPPVELVSDVSWLSTGPCCTALPAQLSVTVDPTGLPDGVHTGGFTARADGYVSATYSVELSVAAGAPRQVHLAFVGDPTTSVTVVWRTRSDVESRVEYRPKGAVDWSVAAGAVRPAGGAGVLHEATLTGLTPNAGYEYRVPGDAGEVSPIHTFRTAPAGPADFEVVYFADTGIAGRPDGLTTGTLDVVEAIAEISPLVTLPGGDYAYFNTDNDRFADLEEAIDAWFDQVAPFAANAPMMPTYGNHEVLLGESYDSWAARFPTPTGHDRRRNYSFDLGPVHFTSLFAVYNQTGLTSGQLQWLREDLAAARAAGQSWLVPYMHVSAFADGGNHPSNLELRRQLGPIFEAYDVDLVLMSHDQSYERTWPLVDVPATNTPTSTRVDCVSKADGVTWVKVSPAGKLSNKNADFSQWMTVPPPPWTAVRSNTHHHIAKLRVAAEGWLHLDVIGLPGNGAPATLVDSVRFAAGAC